MINKRIPTRSRSRLRQRQGFTLTEIAIVLGIIGVILGAIWVAAAGVYNNQRINTANTAVLQMTRGIRSLYASSNSTGYTAATDMTSALIQANAVPNNLISGSTMVGPFPGGKTAVIATSDSSGFVIAMSKVSQANCISLLNAVGGTNRDPGLYNADAIATADPATTDATTTGTALTTAITPAIAASSAAGGTAPSLSGGCGASATVKVRFGFSLK